jgi:diketogulonate reductase-like aldo/keto reductase
MIKPRSRAGAEQGLYHWSMDNRVHTVALPAGEEWPALGLGTWRMGEVASRRAAEVRALRQAFEIGYRVIDTAEMYGEGGAEQAVGEALAGAAQDGLDREDFVVVSKVYPHNASAEGVVAACERSLRRLGIEQLDLYLLHWRGGVPLADTVAGFERLQRAGRIRHWGVSNLDLEDLHELDQAPGGRACSANQVYYSISERGPELALLPWMRARQMPLMAYSPIDQGALADHPSLRAVAERHAATPAQIALAWVLHQPGVMAIPKAAQPLHLRHNWAAASLALSAADLAQLERLFPPPRQRQPLSMR